MADLKGKITMDWYINSDILTFNFKYKEGRNVIGSYSVYSYSDSPNVCYLANLIVDESHRNKGIAKQMINKLDVICTNLIFKKISLRVKETDWVHEWYKRLGFIYYMDDKEDGMIWMVKSLSNKK